MPTKKSIFNKGCTGADLEIQKISKNVPKIIQAYFNTYPLTTEQVQNLSNALEQNTYLKRLDMLDCKIEAKDYKILLEGLERNSSIVEIHIDKNAIDNDLHQAFQNAVKQTSSLTNGKT